MELENEPLIQMNSILYNIEVDEEIIENGKVQDSFDEVNKIDSEPFSILDDNFEAKTLEQVDDKNETSEISTLEIDEEVIFEPQLHKVSKNQDEVEIEKQSTETKHKRAQNMLP